MFSRRYLQRLPRVGKHLRLCTDWVCLRQAAAQQPLIKNVSGINPGGILPGQFRVPGDVQGFAQTVALKPRSLKGNTHVMHCRDTRQSARFAGPGTTPHGISLHSLCVPAARLFGCSVDGVFAPPGRRHIDPSTPSSISELHRAAGLRLFTVKTRGLSVQWIR